MDLASQTALLMLLMACIGAIAAYSYYKQYHELQPKQLTLMISSMLFLITPFALVYLALGVTFQTAMPARPALVPVRATTPERVQRARLSLVK